MKPSSVHTRMYTTCVHGHTKNRLTNRGVVSSSRYSRSSIQARMCIHPRTQVYPCLNSSVIRRRSKRANIQIYRYTYVYTYIYMWFVVVLHEVTSMTKAGQTCLTTCKIPMNERNLPLVSLVTSDVCPGSLFRECARARAEQANERLRPRPLLNSTTSRSRDTLGLRYGIKGEDLCHVTPMLDSDQPTWPKTFLYR